MKSVLAFWFSVEWRFSSVHIDLSDAFLYCWRRYLYIMKSGGFLVMWWLAEIFFLFLRLEKKKCICSFSHGMQRLTLCSGHESLPVTTTISCMWHVSRECFIYHPLITFFFPLYLVVWSLPTDITVFFEDTYFTTTISQIRLK